MKQINFYYGKKNLAGAVSYLFAAKANPVVEKDHSEVEKLLQSAVVGRFEEIFKDQIVKPETLEGTLHGGIVWRGLSCTLHAFDGTALRGLPAEVSISEDSPDTISHIQVVFHIAAGEP